METRNIMGTRGSPNGRTATTFEQSWREFDWAERFESQWKSNGAPPSIPEFLPDPSSLRRAALLQLIKIDIEQRWLRTGHPKLLSDYCADYPELSRDEVPPELIRDEITFRRNSGQAVDPHTYLREYPTQATRLEQLLDLGDSTAVSSDSPTLRRADALETVDVGQRIDDFDLLTPLGTGAFARVFLARQHSMQRLVAVKISQNHGTEPQTLAQLDHDYIVRIFDQRVIAERDLRLLYMQYLPGGTLQDVMRTLADTSPEDRTGDTLLDAIDAALADKGEIRPTDSSVRAEILALSWPETVAWLGRRLAEALDYADRHRVLHRDVKPANILLTAEGVPKLAVFNISFAGTVPGTNPVSYFGGSLAYMSPEQLAACHPDDPAEPSDLDTRSDIYALGVVLWELLTSRKPFSSNDLQLDQMLADRRAGVSPAALATLPADTPVTLRRILLTCLAPDPADRWATGAELAQQFDICLNPPARELVDPPPGSWRYRLRPWSILIMELGVVGPNALAAILNWYVIRTLVIGELGTEAQSRFDAIFVVVNATSFPLGALLILYMRRYLVLVPHGLRKGKTYDAETLARARTDAILLADRVVAVLCGIWVSSATAWAIAMWIVIPDVTPGGYLYFFATVLICTTIAVTYPYFLVAYYAIRCLYPTFLPHGEVPDTDSVRMRRVRVRSVRYLAVAAAIPLVGVTAATFVPLDQIGSVIVAIRIVCIGGIAAFMGAYWTFRKVEGDLATLEGVTSDSGESMKDL